jgi:indole-3-glycerol phosphate synthase
VLVDTVPDILARIVARKRGELAQATISRTKLERLAEELRAGRREFRAALDRKTPAIIAEIKKASPSQGILRAEFEAAALAREYQENGAAAISVLTDGPFFQGSLADLRAARQAVRLPALRKDFTLNEYHVVEAAANGADAVLLITAILDEKQIRDLRELAGAWGMAALIEVHNQRELKTALDAGAEIVGVNNRNLKTFEVTLETSVRLAEDIPDGVLKISESGIHSREDIQRLEQAGFHAFLVGEHFLKAASPGAALRALAGPA